MTHDVTFTCMGCEMRLLAVGAGDGEIRAARELLDAIDARLSRFRAGSELARLNADPHATVPASPLLRAAVGAALWAAERTGGLGDPTLHGDLERAGYAGTLSSRPRTALQAALAAAPERAQASPRAEPRWRAVRIDNAAGTITRPPGLRLDTGGTTKGLAADAAAQVLGRARRPAGRAGDARALAPNAAVRALSGARWAVIGRGGDARAVAPSSAVRALSGARRAVVDRGDDPPGFARRLVVDCGGDLRVAVAAGAAPFEIAVEHPLTGDRAATLRLRGGGVATSGLGRRIWLGPDGRPAHHLLDPATGTPAWTGLIAATAIAATTLGAEALAKAALLSGPSGARRLLRRGGGVLIHDDGSVERVGPRRAVAPDERLRVAA